MADAKLSKLKRADLLEMLLEQSKENEKLRAEIEELKQQLADRRIYMEQAGNIAEAALKINGVMEAAQAAAQQYLDNIKLLGECQKKEISE